MASNKDVGLPRLSGVCCTFHRAELAFQVPGSDQFMLRAVHQLVPKTCQFIWQWLKMIDPKVDGFKSQG